MEKVVFNRNIDLFKTYREYISSQKPKIVQFDMLSKEEQNMILKNVQNGDALSINFLILSNIKLVSRILNIYYKKIISSDNIEDIFQIGLVGLIMGAQKYNKEEVAFSTWASYYIRRTINKQLSKICCYTTISDSTLRRVKNIENYYKLKMEKAKY